uniref:NADH-plastoquinone oxidoreductase subunit 4 n=1 Tax=Campsis radicans TaxID=83937 RepID=UPI00240F7BEF|nr:NADH-plastoquinone oxidoreductase subunit 4 [Campsis radicans]WES82111.1 NADH-plastoquinone oxidoreductase subunit 4 [Campsis radicans]
MYVLVHVRVHVEYQRELFMFKQVSIIPLSRLQIYGVGWFPAPRPVLVDSRVGEKGQPLPLKLQRQMLFVQ